MIAALLALALLPASAALADEPVAGISKKRVKVKLSGPKAGTFHSRLRFKAKLAGPRKKLKGAKLTLEGRSTLERSRWQALAAQRLRRPKGRVKLAWKADRDGPISVRLKLKRGKRALAKSSPKTVRVKHKSTTLEPGLVSTAPLPGARGSLVYEGRLKAKKGTILASDIGPVLPSGFLGEVVSATYKGGKTRVTTKPATLFEAVPRGSFDATVDYGSGTAQGATLSTTRTRRSLPSSISESVSCAAGGSVELSGSLDLSPVVEVDADWGWFSLDSVRFEAGLDASAQLLASARAAASCTLERTAIGSYPLPAFTVFAGPIPVVFTPRISIYISAEGEIEGEISSSVTASMSARAGAIYDHGQITPLASITPNFDYQPPNPRASAHLGGRVEPTMELLIYGVAGPQAFVETGLSLDADSEADPWWTLSARIRAGGRLIVPVLDVGTGDLNLYDQTFVLAQAQGPRGSVGSNDSFAGAKPLGALPVSEDGGTAGASREPDEPGTGAGPSVWYSFDSGTDGEVRFDTCTSSFDTTLDVYTGQGFADFEEVASSDDGCSEGSGSEVSFFAERGETYWIQVAGYEEEQTGSFTLRGSGSARRLEIGWSTDADIDLHAFDAEGNHAYFDDQYAIPDAAVSRDIIPDEGDAGRHVEYFDAFSDVPFAYCIYYYGDPGSESSTSIDFTITDPGGGTRTGSVSLSAVDDGAFAGTSPDGGLSRPTSYACGDASSLAGSSLAGSRGDQAGRAGSQAKQG